jgi:hypothetical protein
MLRDLTAEAVAAAPRCPPQTVTHVRAPPPRHFDRTDRRLFRRVLAKFKARGGLMQEEAKP